MGNIHPLNCCSNPSSITISDEAAAEKSTPSKCENPSAALAGQSSHAHKIDQPKFTRDVQDMNANLSCGRGNKRTGNENVQFDNAVPNPEKSIPSTSELPSSSLAVQSPGNETEQSPMRNVEVGNENPSADYTSEQVFLSHSGKQKDFADQLCVDLNNADISCFFDKYSLPKGEEFPRRIFDAAKKCKVAVVVLSQDFISSKWPMQELCAFAEALTTTNPNLHIFPLYYRMTSEELRQQIANIESGVTPKDWKYIRNSRKVPIDTKDCLRTLGTLLSINGLTYKMQGEVAYRRQIVDEIRSMLPPNIKHEDPSVRGRVRVCQEVVANLFDRAPDVNNGVKVGGLYGIHGSGKTTICKCLCDFYSDQFEGLRAFHAEFDRKGLPVETLKRLVMILTNTDEAAVKFVSDYKEAVSILKRRIRNQRVFLALDNIPDSLKSFQEVRAYLTVGFGEGSLILLTAETKKVLESVSPIQNEGHLMRVPSLTKQEAIDVLLHQISLNACDLTDEQRNIAEECAKLCRLGLEMSNGQGNYHPLALTAFGVYLCKDFTCNLSHLLQIPDQFWEYASVQGNPFYIFERCFNSLDPKYLLRIFMLLPFYAPHFELTGKFDYFGAVLKWLAEVSTTEDHISMSDAIFELKKKNLIQGCRRDRNFFSDLRKKLESNQFKEMEEWMSLAGENNIPILARSIVEAIKIEDCKLIRRLNLTDCPCPNLRSLTLRKNESLTEVVGLNGLLALEKLHLEEMSNLEELPSFESLTNLTHLTLYKMQNLKEQPDLTRCPHMQEKNIYISECKWQNECE